MNGNVSGDGSNSNDESGSTGKSGDLTDFFALPAFKADEALVQLSRDLRALKPLAEKGTGASIRFEWKALPAIELSLDDGSATPGGKPVIHAASAKRPSQRPEWLKQKLASSAEVRKWLDGVKLSLKRWDDED